MTSWLLASLLTTTARAQSLQPPTKPAYGIDAERSLMITDLRVVNDPRTRYPGPWSFGRLMEQIAGPQDASKFAYKWLAQFYAEQEVNGFLVPRQEDAMVERVLEPWIAQSKKNGYPDGALDLSIAPFRLLGIVNRIDLRQTDGYGNVTNAGEARFAFGVLAGPGGGTTLATTILEYHQLARSPAEVRSWAKRWHALEQYTIGKPEYLRALEELTALFAGEHVAPQLPNGSALSQVRINELLGGGPWTWHEFRLDASGALARSVVAQSIDSSLNGTKALADYINENEAAILAGEHVVPLEFRGQPFAGAVSAGEDISAFMHAPGIRNNDARHLFSLQNCVACHTQETGTSFFQMGPRSEQFPTALGAFLTGIRILDPVDGTTTRSFHDILRRQQGLHQLLTASDASIASERSLKRVH